MYGVLTQLPTRSAKSRARKHVTMRVGWLIRAAVTLSACSTGQIEEATNGDIPFSADASSPAGSKNDSGNPPSTNPGSAGGAAPIPSGTNCSGPTAAPAPLARLTNLEYRNTLNTLFSGITMPDVDLPADNVVEGFDNNSKA